MKKSILTNIIREEIQLIELARFYELYHNTYTSAVQAAKQYAAANGFKVDDGDWSRNITLGPGKPGIGRTVKHNIRLIDATTGKQSSKALHIQVFNMGTNGKTYELTCYIN